MRRALGVAGLALTGALSACTPQGLWGSEARYAADLRGYVVARSPDEGRRYVLKSPVTRKKIRCREDVEPFLPSLTQVPPTLFHDMTLINVEAASLTVGMAPLAAPAALLWQIGEALRVPPEVLYAVTSSPGASRLYAQGKRALDQHRDRDAERAFERAALKRDGASGDEVRAVYFLGVLYEREGRAADAVRAYKEFVERATLRDEEAYASAEARLAALDPAALPLCRSQAPITFVWPPPRRAPGDPR